jgi:hypothetical protein
MFVSVAKCRHLYGLTDFDGIQFVRFSYNVVEYLHVSWAWIIIANTSHKYQNQL